ncbi:MAG: acetamidase/formamidase family protein [Chloroflexi bacterium]|uniref:acetamidase/formamidase family protein n=1 Tax=Candidatus Flexifilum breve TaxID=3140694 RepID=UPI003134FAC0|nr:acetamidase/formamidase family protein [Chloroflexota bacterium]
MTIHHFTPTIYHRTMGSHAPVLHIAPGDSVITTTVDAWGLDASEQKATEGGNPMTGPFYIDGAEVGDTLVVYLDHLAPSRATGWGRPRLATNVVNPDEVASLPEQNEILHWVLERERGTASLRDPLGKLGHFTLSLNPMLGCFGVAAMDGQAISTATSAEHGGNMDYNGFVAGTTVYFPVFAPGALFHLGDGHAAQGDGEVCGTGIETSFEVKFTVDVLKGVRSRWPRGENKDYIFTVGNARPLDQAMQHATTEMLAWLQQRYGYSLVEANVLIGYGVEYDLGNMFDPAYTMVCKLPKRLFET